MQIRLVARRFFEIVASFIAGVFGNLLASWIQQDVWASVFAPYRLLGTVIGAAGILALSAWLGLSDVSNKTSSQSSFPRPELFANPEQGHQETMHLTSRADRHLPSLLLLASVLVLCLLAYAFTSIFFTQPGIGFADEDITQPFVSVEQIRTAIAICFYPLAVTTALVLYRHIAARYPKLIARIQKKGKLE